MSDTSESSYFKRMMASVDHLSFLSDQTPPLAPPKTHRKNRSADLGAMGGHFESDVPSIYPGHLTIDTQAQDVDVDHQPLEAVQLDSEHYQPQSRGFPPTPTTPTVKDLWGLPEGSVSQFIKDREERNSASQDFASTEEAPPMSSPPGSPNPNQNHYASDDDAVFAHINRSPDDMWVDYPTAAPSMVTTDHESHNEREGSLDQQPYWLSGTEYPYDRFASDFAE